MPTNGRALIFLHPFPPFALSTGCVGSCLNAAQTHLFDAFTSLSLRGIFRVAAVFLITAREAA